MWTKSKKRQKAMTISKYLLIETLTHGRLFNIQSLKFSEPALFCLVLYRVVYIMMCICKTFFEVTKLFFPRLRDICRQQRKALSYKPVGKYGQTLIGFMLLHYTLYTTRYMLHVFVIAISQTTSHAIVLCFFPFIN